MKKMRVYLPVLVLILLIIHGCSYMESFMLYNDSASKVVVKYRLDKDKAIGSPLFGMNTKLIKLMMTEM